ncbi:uncharacterized protein LOC132714644 isoform X2 [Ruditapes philippinarum]|uniref:uncharacterized protein LOC132714644 isoform X2 n=1 Tax=Ruditapes philippinarum TaxID=129788 RepID=UPI00295A84E3|nr:uncharacterized protein LOC132714644 isoform X2 [Ruditapes philippinarum]
MEDPPQTQDGEENTELARVRRKFLILFIVKFLLGFLLLLLGGLAVKNTETSDGFGPPYYIGAFLVGCATCFEVGLTVVAILSGFIGIFFVAIFGVPKCDPSSFFSHCNYNINMGTNRNIAISILVFLIAGEILGIASIVMNNLACRGVGVSNIFKARPRRYNTAQNVYMAGGGGTVVMSTAPEQTPIIGGFGYGNYRRNDNYSADTQIVIGGQVIDKNRGGFSGAVIHPPENTTVHPFVGYYPDNQGATGQHPTFHQDESVNQLQEQNRLLREQIALQQQQLQLMQQQQHQQLDASSTMPPPPPSYESCLQDPTQIKFLQQQNEELLNRCQTQQYQISEKTPVVHGTHPNPSAPPM